MYSDPQKPTISIGDLNSNVVLDADELVRQTYPWLRGRIRGSEPLQERFDRITRELVLRIVPQLLREGDLSRIFSGDKDFGLSQEFLDIAKQDFGIDPQRHRTERSFFNAMMQSDKFRTQITSSMSTFNEQDFKQQYVYPIHANPAVPETLPLSEDSRRQDYETLETLHELMQINTGLFRDPYVNNALISLQETLGARGVPVFQQEAGGIVSAINALAATIRPVRNTAIRIGAMFEAGDDQTFAQWLRDDPTQYLKHSRTIADRLWDYPRLLMAETLFRAAGDPQTHLANDFQQLTLDQQQHVEEIGSIMGHHLVDFVLNTERHTNDEQWHDGLYRNTYLVVPPSELQVAQAVKQQLADARTAQHLTGSLAQDRLETTKIVTRPMMEQIRQSLPYTGLLPMAEKYFDEQMLARLSNGPQLFQDVLFGPDNQQFRPKCATPARIAAADYWLGRHPVQFESGASRQYLGKLGQGIAWGIDKYPESLLDTMVGFVPGLVAEGFSDRDKAHMFSGVFRSTVKHCLDNDRESTAVAFDTTRKFYDALSESGASHFPYDLANYTGRLGSDNPLDSNISRITSLPCADLDKAELLKIALTCRDIEQPVILSSDEPLRHLEDSNHRKSLKVLRSYEPEIVPPTVLCEEHDLIASTVEAQTLYALEGCEDTLNYESGSREEWSHIAATLELQSEG